MIQAFIAPGKVIDLTGDLADVTIEDIARCLSLQVRFNGALGPLSVAEHSIHVANHAKHILHCTPQEELAALLHDAHEALLGDITRPAIAFLGPEVAERVKRAKEIIDRKLEKRFGLPELILNRDIIAEADLAALQHEILRGNLGEELRQNMGHYTDFTNRFNRIQKEIEATKTRIKTKAEG